MKRFIQKLLKPEGLVPPTLRRGASKVPILSDKEAVILLLLSGAREMYGLEMVEAADGELKRGTVYVTLDRMEDKGYVESRLEEKAANMPGLPRRLYRVTGYGATVLEAREHYMVAVDMGGVTT